MGHRDAYGRRLRWYRAQKRQAKIWRERTHPKSGPSTPMRIGHPGMYQHDNPSYHPMPQVNSIQRSDGEFFYPTADHKPMLWNYPIESDQVIGRVNRTVRVNKDLHLLPQSVFEEISKNLNEKERLNLLTSTKSSIEAWGGESYVKDLRQSIKNRKTAYQGWRWWCRYGRAIEARDKIPDRDERAMAAREHFRKYN